MALQNTPPKPVKNLAWKIIRPLVLVVILAICWSVYWMVASEKAMEVIDQALAREKAKGLDLTCAKRQIGGYPFKFVLTCDDVQIVRKTNRVITKLTATRLVVAVRAYDYNHMIGELYGPFEVSQERTSDPNSKTLRTHMLFHGTAATVTSSLILKNRFLKQATVVIRGLKGTLVDHSDPGDPENIATDIEEIIFHVRSDSDTSETSGDYGVAGSAKNLFLVGGRANFHSENGLRFEDILVRMKITNAPFHRTANVLDWLKQWQADNGKANITEINITSGAVKLTGSGNFKLDKQGRTKGVIKTRIIGLETLIKELVSNGRIREKEANLGLVAINLLGGGGGGSGVKVALRATKGNLYFGPFKIAVLKPLFEETAAQEPNKLRLTPLLEN